MSNFEQKELKIFETFHKQWALVTAGNIDDFNTCTVSWGSLGTLWSRPGKTGSVATVYIHPARYTNKFMRESDTFTISFFSEEHRKALGYLGSHSGRNEDKVATAGLTPTTFEGGVTFKEANYTLVCKKIYQHQFAKEDIAKDVQEYYMNNPTVYPVNKNGEWEPHWVFVGEIMNALDKQ